jgi:ribosomal small subunit protein bTHX
MGKGDKKTTKGKRLKGSYGVSRKKKTGKGKKIKKRTTKAKKIEDSIEELDTVVETTGKEKPKPKQAPAKRAVAKKPAKKAAAKKPANKASTKKAAAKKAKK